MKILIITPSCHGKNIGAVQRDIYGTIELLKKMHHEVVLYTVRTTHRDLATIQSVALQYQIEVKVFEPTLNFWQRLKDMISDSWLLFDGAADVFAQMTRDQEFNLFIKQFKPDVMFSFCSYSWPILRLAKCLGVHAVFRSHNFESNFFWESLSLLQKFNLLNWLRRLVKFFGEKRAVQCADVVATLPFSQINQYRLWKNGRNIYMLTLIFLAEAMREPNVHTNKQQIDLFYLGANYDVIFHCRGAEILIEDIAPRVLKIAGDQFKFHICGAKLPKYLAEKCQGNIIYEGYVPDLEAFLEKMDAGVFPVMTGKTMKGKVFDALARSFPMVISKNCLGGYQLTDRKEVLIADSIDEFVKKILLLRDAEIRKNLAAGARKFCLERFTEDKILSVLNQVLKIGTVR